MRNFPSSQTGNITNRLAHSSPSPAVILYPYPEQNVVRIGSIISVRTSMTQGWFLLDMSQSQAAIATVVKSTLEMGVEHALSRLEEFEHLEEDWDSYGAPPLERAVIEEARTIIHEIGKKDYMLGVQRLEFYPIPNRSGGVSLYFEFDDRELRIKFYPHEDKQIVYRVIKTDPQQYKYAESTYDRDNLDRHLNWLISGHE